MTFKVNRSAIQHVDYPAMVAAHASDLKTYAAHLAAVERGEAQHYPPPVAPEIVDRAVRRPNFVPDYEIVEDGPTEAELFRRRQGDLMNQVTRLENEAAHRVVPIGKRRLLALQRDEIARREMAIEEFTPEKRSPDDAAFIAAHETREARMRAIIFHGAKLHAEIEDLDSSTIEGWKPTAFPE